MSDLIYLAVIIGFFAVAVGLLRFCERIIGPDTTTPSASADPSTAPTVDEPEAVTA